MSGHEPVSFRTLILNGVALFILTILTVAVYYIDFPDPMNLIVALAIATFKAALVCLFFMNLYWDDKFNSVVFLSSVLFFLIFVGITLLDTLFREAPFQIF